MLKNYVFTILLVIFFCMAIPLPLPFDFDNIVLALFLFLDIILILVYKRRPNFAFLKWNVLFIIFCASSILWSIDPHLSRVQVAVRMMANLSLGVFLTTYPKNYRQLSTILSAFYVSSILYFLYVASIVDFSSMDEGRIAGAISDDDIAERMNSNYIAGRLAFAFYAGLFLLWKFKNNKYTKCFHIVFSVFIFYVVLMSGSRASLLILIIPPLVYIMLRAKHLIKSLAYIVIGFAMTFYVVMKIPVFYEIIGTRIEDAVNVVTGNETGNEDVSRLMLITYGIEWFSEKPVLGYGINCFKVLSDRAMLFSTRGKYAHNNYIELMVDVGLVGLLLYYSIFVYLFKSVKGLKRQSSTEILKVLLVLILIIDFFWVGYYNRLSQILLWMTFNIISLEKSKLNILKRENKNCN